MSRVTGIVLVHAICDDHNAQRISDRLVARSWPPLSPDRSEGFITGGKHPQLHVRGAGINYFSAGAATLIEDFLATPWIMPENAILIVDPEDEATQIHRPRYDGDER